MLRSGTTQLQGAERNLNPWPLLVLLLLLPVACTAAAADDAVMKGKGDDTSPDGTYCGHVFNLQEANRLQAAAPTVVDINVETGNILVRGPLPLIVRDGSDNNKGCKNRSEWTFAYDQLNAMIQHDRSFVPVYITGAKRGTLTARMQDFDLKDYRFIDISLLNTGPDNTGYFNAENRSFDAGYARCSAAIPSGTILGRDGGIVWSSVGCDANDYDGCTASLYKDTEQWCSYASLQHEIATLMREKDPSGKRRVIYYHCTHGADRTGSVTVGYLATAFPEVTLAHAIIYDQFLGEDAVNPARMPANGWTINNPQMLMLPEAYCRDVTKDSVKCSPTEGTRVNLPGRDTHSHLPGQEDPVMTPAPVPDQVPLPAQTPVPGTPYNPTKSGDVIF